jgi:phosphoglycerate kinase
VKLTYKKTIRDIDVEGKRVLVRVDFNVPLDINTGAISDDSRIRASLPTLEYLVEHKAKVILCTHLGRPEGKVVETLRIAPIAQRLSQLTGLPVKVAQDCIGAEVEKTARALSEGDILFLENLRFHSQEEANDPGFAQQLARLAEIYVNDAFGTAHRAHASTVGVARYLPAVGGFLMEKELEAMSTLLNAPDRPFACLIGGAKVSDKIGLLRNMLKRVDIFLVGGGMAATLLKAQGHEVGLSLVEAEKLGLSKELLQEAQEHNVPLLLPLDVVAVEKIATEAEAKTVPATKVPHDLYIVDIGPQTIELFSDELKKCRTIMWNGPVGVYEIPRFGEGTRAMARLLASLNSTTIVGGGSTAEIVEEMGLADKMTHVSTGGGASLRFLEGATLPGVEALLDKE